MIWYVLTYKHTQTNRKAYTHTHANKSLTGFGVYETVVCPFSLPLLKAESLNGINIRKPTSDSFYIYIFTLTSSKWALYRPLMALTTILNL